VKPSTGRRFIDLSKIFDEQLTEIGQAKNRLWLTILSMAYLSVRWVGVDPLPLFDKSSVEWVALPTENAMTLLYFSCGYGLFSIAIFGLVRGRPGNFVWRRLLGMSGDFVALAYVMLVGELLAMPFFALILWVTLGNGMRFGGRYLAIAAVLAQASFFALLVASPFWRAQIAVMITFSLSAFILPAYAYILLRQTANARDAAFAATQAKSRFLAQASHDLRQPVHAIGYYLDIMREEERKTERAKLIDRIDRALGSVAGLFKSLLDISRLDSGTVEVKVEAVALDALIRDVIHQHEQTAEWNGVQLRFVKTSLNAWADPTLLAIMVQNLLSNAIKYARGKKVLIGVRRKGDTLSIEVHDQGIGIEDEHLPHIFEEFYRAHVAGDHDSEGVGLGLSIVSRSAQLSGFVADLKSRRGIGTIAGIYGIPITQLQAPARRAKSEAPTPLSGFRVILIEDDRDVLEATRQLLERWNCVVQAFSSRPQGVEPADLIIADFDLGQGELGTKAISEIRRHLGVDIPAILLTGHAEVRVRERIGDDDIQILAKPVQPAVLRSVLSAFRLAGRKQSQSLSARS
jgi:signal transduction histidine kinase